MPGETNPDSPQPPHVELVDDNPTERHEGEQSPGLTNGKGWDGKLRVPGRASLANPEALSDPEYSDDDNVVPGQEIEADEGCYYISPPSRTSNTMAFSGKYLRWTA